jgi:phosphohistidine phosphatase
LRQDDQYSIHSVSYISIITRMRLYLIQHGEAVAKEVDPDRPLSPQGKRDVEVIAKSLKSNGVSVSKILHSGKTRARQTAEILVQIILNNGHIEAIDGIAPNDSVESFANTIPALETNTMIVGHLPFMAKLVSQLTTGTENTPLVTYLPGSIVCLEQNENHNWQIQWMIRPDCL